MKFLTSRVVVSAIASFIAFAIVPAIATTPEADFKTVTSKAYVDSLISNNDISGHKVNGVALSNANITLYGRSSTGATTAAKAVKVYNSAEGDVTIGALSTGMVIVVKPTSTATTAPTTLNVNGLGAKNMRYNGAAITTANAAKVWNKDNPSIWVYDGTNWNFAGGGKGADNLVWGASETTSTNAYDTTFVGDTGATANAWPAADKTKIVDTPALAGALSLKQNKITTGLVDFYSPADEETRQVPSLVSYDSTNGLSGNQIGILDYENTNNDGFWTLTGSAMDNFVPTVRAVADVVNRLSWMTYYATYTSAINAYNTEFGNGTNNWAGNANDLITGQFLANSLALKQNKITTGRVLFHDDDNNAHDLYVPALVSYGTGASGTDGILGNKIGILDQVTIDEDDDEGLQYYGTYGGYGAEMDNFVPTVRAVANALMDIWDNLGWSALSWSVNINGTPDNGANRTNAINAYNTTFGTGTNKWAGNANDLINGQFLANSLALKQKKLPAKSTGNYEPRGGQTIDLDTAGNPGIRYITPSMDGAVSTHGLTTKSGAPSVWDYIDGSQDLTTFTNNTFGTTTGITLAQNKKYVMGALVTLDLLKDVYTEINTTISEDLHGAAGEVPVYDNDGFINGHSRAIYSGPTAQAPYNATNDADKLAAASFVETKQNKLPAQASGAPVTIPTYPAYGESDGAIGKMYLDTSSLYTTDNTHFPSSKLVATTLDLYVQKRDAWNMTETNEWLGATSDGAVASVSGLYLIPGLADSGTQWAKAAMIGWGDKKTVPTMDTLAKSLAGLYNAVGDLIGNQILDHDGTSSSLSSASVPVPTQIEYTIEYTGARTLNDGNQLFWLPQLNKDGVQEATRLLKTYSADKIVPSMDELAYALDGVLQTHETTSEWYAVLNYHSLGDVTSLFELAHRINGSDDKAILLNRSGYLQTFAPSLELLMNESHALYKLIVTKQDMLPAKSTGNAAPKGNQAVVLNIAGNPSNVYTTAGKNLALTAKSGAQMVMNYVDGTTAPATFASSQGLSEANVKAALVSLELLRDVYTTIDANKQQVMPAAGKYIDSNLDTVEIRDYTNREVKGEEVVTSAGTAGAVGKRQIFEAGTTYTNDAATNIQIATIGAVMENTFTKVCVEYAPGSTQDDSTCWLWQFRSNVCSANGVSCQSSTECCSGFCDGGGTNSREPGVCKELDGLCQGEGQSCSRSADCCDGLTCDSRRSTCVGN